MSFKPYFRLGEETEREPNPIPGNSYWVVARNDEIEIAFQALLVATVGRDHHVEPEDRTPSFQFDNGVILHGAGILFFNKRPEKPLKGLRFCSLYKDPQGGPYRMFSQLTETSHQKDFADLAELQQFLRSLDIDEGSIPQDDFSGSLELELRL